VNYDPDSLIPLTGTELAEGVTAEEAADWFKDTIFIGDSVTMGFRNYIMYQQQQGNADCMGAPLFVVSGSLSARAALDPISEDSLHPLYKGKKRLIEDVVAEVGAKRIFIQLGLNEIAVDGLEAPIDYMEQLIGRIREKSPDVEIHLISTTYMVQGSEKKHLNNPNIRKLNYNRMKYAASKGYGYIDVANNICDENGYLFSEYSSDQYVHQVNTSYEVWEKVCLSYASHQIAGK